MWGFLWRALAGLMDRGKMAFERQLALATASAEVYSRMRDCTHKCHHPTTQCPSCLLGMTKVLTHSTSRIFLTGWSMSEHEQSSMLSSKVLLFFLTRFFILMSLLADLWNIWTYTYARWFHADNWNLFLRSIIFFRGFSRWQQSEWTYPGRQLFEFGKSGGFTSLPSSSTFCKYASVRCL